MDDKIKVSLEVDTSKSTNNIDKLQTKMDTLQKKINNIGNINVNINKNYTQQIANLQKRISDIKVDIDTSNFKEGSNTISELQENVEILTNKLVSLKDKQFAESLKAVKNIEFDPKAIADIKNFKLQTEGISGTVKKFKVDLPFIAKNIKDLKIDSKDLKEYMGETSENVEKTSKRTGILGTLFARVGKQISRQVYTQIASLLNPINNVKKVLSYLTDVVNPRLGATFKNIGENLIEYFATSNIFGNLIHQAILLIYLLQQIFNVFARIFNFGQIDLFKTSMKTGKKLQKMQQQMLAGFDEINDIGSSNQQDQLDATPLGVGELISDEEKKKLDEIADKFSNIGKIIKDIVDWVKKFWKEILIAVAIVGLLVLAIKGIKLFGGKGTGLDELNKGIGEFANNAGKALEMIAILGGIALVLQALSQLVLAFKDNSDALGSVLAVLSLTFGGITLLMLSVAKLGPQMTAGLIPFLTVIGSIIAILLVMKETLPTILDAVGKFIQDIAPSLVLILDSIFNGINNIIGTIGDVLIPLVEEVGKVFDKIFNGINKVVLSVGTVIVNVMTTAGDVIEQVARTIINFINDLGPAIRNLTHNIVLSFYDMFNAITRGFETIVNNGVTAINWLLSPLRDLGNDVLKLVGIKNFKFKEISKMPGLAKLATGTNYVPNDQLAYIHQGEAVIPKKFNEREYFGGGNDETNNLLEVLIDKIDNIDFSPYTTVKDVGKAAVEYMKETSRQTGRSMI